MLTPLDKLLSSYNLDDVAYMAKFKDVDTNVYEKATDRYFFYSFLTKKKRKEYCSNR